MLKLGWQQMSAIEQRMNNDAPQVPSFFFLCILATAFLVLTLEIYSQSYHPVDLGVYLSAATCFFDNKNAWDPAQLTAVAHQRGFLPELTLVLGLWTPPIVFPILYPFSTVHFELAKTLWLILSVTLTCLSLALLHHLYPHLSMRRLTIQALLFPPFLALLVWGQISALILTGFLFFLYFESRRWDFLAGAILLLALSKPHIGFLVWIYLPIFILTEHRWRIAAGFLTTLASSIIILGALQPDSFAFYFANIKDPPLAYNASTLFGVIHKELFPNSPITQFGGLLMAVPLCFFLLCTRSRTCPAPRDIIPTLLLASKVLAPYGWVYDQVVVFPFFVLFAEQSVRRYGASWVWAILCSSALGYYALILPEWGDNDWRPMMFPCGLVLIFGLCEILKRRWGAEQER